MIYTKEQKRDIAEQLRYWGSYEGKCKLINKYVCGVLGVEGRDALNMLADLIEPDPDLTCELEPTASERTSALVRVYECDCCGRSCDSVYAEDYVYCPYCGRPMLRKDVIKRLIELLDGAGEHE